MFASQPIIQSLRDGVCLVANTRSKRDRGWRRIAEHDSPDPIEFFAESEVNLARLIELLLAQVTAVVAALTHHKSPLGRQVPPQRLGHPLVLKTGPA